MCVDIVCGQTGWKQYQTNGANAIGNWLQLSGYGDSTCTRLRLEPDFVALPKPKPANCPDDTDAIMEVLTPKSQKLADHRSVEALKCVNVGQVIDCSIDFAQFDHGFEAICEENNGIYLEVDYDLVCQEAGTSTRLTLTGTNDPFCVSSAFCEPSDYANEAEVRAQSMIDILTTEGWNCAYQNNLVFEDFVPSFSPSISPGPTTSIAPSLNPSVSLNPTSSSLPSSEPTLMGCIEASGELIEKNQKIRSALESINTEMNKLPEDTYCTETGAIKVCNYDYTVIDHTLKDDCEVEGGTYVEHTMQSSCISATTGVETITKHFDRPYCVADRCANIEMTDYFYDYYKGLPIDTDIRCPTYTLLEMLVGGRSAVQATPVTFGCQDETNVMSSTIAILNARSMIKSDYKAFAEQDIRNFCPSKKPGFLDCDFDFSSSTLNIRNDLENECPTGGGQYLTSAFTVVCYDPTDLGKEVEVTFKNTNVPSCMGYCCSPGESKTLLEEDLTWFTDYYTEEGWNCSSITIDSITAINYDINAACGTASPGSTPTAVPIGVDPNKYNSSDCHDVFGCYGDIQYPLFGMVFTPQTAPTFAPTTAAQHADNLFKDNDQTSGSDGDIGGLGGGAIAGIVIVVMLLFLVLGYFLYHYIRNRQEGREGKREDEQQFYDEEGQGRGFDDEEYYGDPDERSHRSWTTNDWEVRQRTDSVISSTLSLALTCSRVLILQDDETRRDNEYQTGGDSRYGDGETYGESSRYSDGEEISRDEGEDGDTSGEEDDSEYEEESRVQSSTAESWDNYESDEDSQDLSSESNSSGY
jgi:hypothetical protein